MSKVDSLQSMGAACAASASALSTALCAAADVALQIFGVPLQVVLAALTGALGARVFLPPASFWRAAVMAVFWTFAGAFVAQLALWVASIWMSGTPPPGVLAGLALLVSAGGQRVAPILWESGGAALQRKLDGLFKGGERG
jgi:hypothetical protein